MTDEERSLSDRLDAAVTSLDATKESIDEENERRAVRIAKSERAIRWAFRVVALVVVLLIVEAGFTHQAATSAARANRAASAAATALADYKSATTSARMAQCNQQNDSTARERREAVSSAQATADHLAPPATRTPAVEAEVRSYVEDETARAVRNLLLRDCTARGVADFLSTPQGPHAYLPKAQQGYKP